MEETEGVKKMKVAELRAALAARELDTSGNKAALVERLQTAIDEENIEKLMSQEAGEPDGTIAATGDNSENQETGGEAAGQQRGIPDQEAGDGYAGETAVQELVDAGSGMPAEEEEDSETALREARRLQREADDLAREAERSELSLAELTTLRQVRSSINYPHHS